MAVIFLSSDCFLAGRWLIVVFIVGMVLQAAIVMKLYRYKLLKMPLKIHAIAQDTNDFNFVFYAFIKNDMTINVVLAVILSNIVTSNSYFRVSAIR